MIVSPAQQTDENATASRKAKFFSYIICAIYHDVRIIFYSYADLRGTRAIAGKGNRRTELGVSGILQGIVKVKEEGNRKCGDSLPDYHS